MYIYIAHVALCSARFRDDGKSSIKMLSNNFWNSYQFVEHRLWQLGASTSVNSEI